MAANSNMGYHHGAFMASAFNRHAFAFQTGAVSSSTGMIPVSNYSGFSDMAGTAPDGNCGGASNTGGSVVPGSSSIGGFLQENGLKHDTGLALDWSAEEQSILEEGLEKYADESSIMRYIKVAAMLRDKTVRDVALRCRWMTKKDSGKRRLPDEHSTGKKLKDGKEKLLDSLMKTNIPSSVQPNMPTYSLVMQHMNNNDHSSYGVSAIVGITRHLLDENAQTFGQIAANLGACKIQDNIDLLCRTKNNLMAILHDMKEMPGIMSHMPPLPVSINEELAGMILPGAAQASSQVSIPNLQSEWFEVMICAAPGSTPTNEIMLYPSTKNTQPASVKIMELGYVFLPSHLPSQVSLTRNFAILLSMFPVCRHSSAGLLAAFN